MRMILITFGNIVNVNKNNGTNMIKIIAIAIYQKNNKNCINNNNNNNNNSNSNNNNDYNNNCYYYYCNNYL